MNSQDFQQNNEQVKDQITTYLFSNLITIYDSCSSLCLKRFDNDILTDRDKICLSKCFDRKSESYNITVNQISKITEKTNPVSANAKTKIIDGTEVIYE